MSLPRIGLCLAALTVAAGAQGVPKITSLSKTWLERGNAARITVSGENLAGATSLLVDGAPGAKARLVPRTASRLAVESTAGGVSTVQLPDAKSLQVELELDPSAALVERELRIVTPEGVSNPLVFRASPWPELAGADSNTTLETAQPVTLPATLSGMIGAAAETDYYRFKARSGERLIFDLNAYRIGSPLDSSLAILDLSGKELARNEDAAGLDSILEFAAPAEGEYLAQVRDFRYQGGGNYTYRLTAGVLPFVSSAFPYGGQRGQTVEVALKGANLEGAGKLVLSLAPDAPLGRQEIRASTGRGLSNPFPFEVSDLPSFAEREPNGALDQADPIAPPVAVNGKIAKEGDWDAFRFQAEKDQTIVFELAAFRHGSPLDALLTLADDRGAILQRNDDATGTDARIEYRFAQAGSYFIYVEDLLGRGGDDYGYRLAIRSPRPDFSVAFLPDSPRLRRGGRVPIRCEIGRQNGFGEAVRLVAENLPRGVYAEPLLVDRGSPSGLLLLSASLDAELGSFPIQLAGTAVLDGRTSRRAGQPIAGDRPARAAYLTVLPEAPFSIEAATLVMGLEQNQSGQIEVVVERKDGFSGDLTVSPEGFSFGRDPITRSFDIQPVTIKAGQTRGTLALKARLDSEIGTRAVVLRAEGGPNIAEYSAALPVTTTQVPFVLSTTLKKLVVTAMPGGTTSAAAEGLFNVKAERRAGFTGEIALKLEGVPEGITATVTNIAANGAEATIRLVASEKAPSGKDHTLSITGSGVHNDRNYRFQPAAITLTINAPEPAEAKESKLAGSN